MPHKEGLRINYDSDLTVVPVTIVSEVNFRDHTQL